MPVRCGLLVSFLLRGVNPHAPRALAEHWPMFARSTMPTVCCKYAQSFFVEELRHEHGNSKVCHENAQRECLDRGIRKSHE